MPGMFPDYLNGYTFFISRRYTVHLRLECMHSVYFFLNIRLNPALHNE